MSCNTSYKATIAKLKIISGDQTGVDRSALDAALQTGTECGGWCPEGKLAEDGTMPPRYLLSELKGAGYKERTLQNVIDSNGTVIIYFDSLSGGTEKNLIVLPEPEKALLGILRPNPRNFFNHVNHQDDYNKSEIIRFSTGVLM